MRYVIVVAELCIANLALSTVDVCSAPVTFAFKGTVDRVLIYESVGQLTWPEPGTSFHGSYSFDPNATDSSTDPFSGIYTTPPPSGVRVKVGEFELTGTGSYVATHEVFTPAPRDLYEAGNWLGSMELISHSDLRDVLNRNHFQLRIDGNSQLLDGLALPFTPPPLAKATEAPLSLSLDSGLNTRPFPYVLITAMLDSLTLVPEPATWLLAAGASSFLAIRRRT